MTLAQKTITGIIWNFAEQIGRRGIGVFITLLLARFLTPEHYGLVAMMAVFLAVAQSLMNSGFKQALIRLQGAAQIDFNTAFYANICLGIISYFLLFLAAPSIAQFYDEPRLIILIRVAGVNILIHSFDVVQSAILNRELNFKAQLQATVPAGIISGFTAVGLAYLGFGVWALIVQMLLASLITVILLWRFQGWRPTLAFSRRSLASMYNFGYKLFLSGILDILHKNIYVIIIAKLFSATIAGQYFFASKLKDMAITQFMSSIMNVTFPALSKLQDDDKRLKSGYRKVIQVVTFVLFPALLFLAALAEPLFNSLLPEKWLPAALYLQFICLAGVMYPLNAINVTVLKVKGRSGLLLFIDIFKKILIGIILFITYRYGIIGILIGQIISSVLAYIPNSYFASRLINYSVWEQMADFMPGLVLSAVVATIIYSAGFFLHWPALAELLVLASLSGLLYLAGAHALKLQAYILARQMITERLGRK
jgi:O-antigen/teichoic acid export membrane protein